MTSQSTIDKIVNYYDGTTFEYNAFVGLWKHHGFHYGYYDELHTTPWDGMINANRVLAMKARIEKGMKVLDAGCGIGGSSIWLAKNTGAIVTGVTLSEKQKLHAEKLAKKYRLEEKVTFLVRDYCDTKFPANSFDVVWGLESICYAENKLDFLKEAYRVLKSGGKIIVADGYIKKKNMRRKEKELIHAWLSGWAVPIINPSTTEGFAGDMKKTGFQNIGVEDFTEYIRDFSLWLHRIAKRALPIMKPLHRLGIFSKTQIDNGTSAYLQYLALQQNLWAYMIYQGEKSDARPKQ